MDLRDAFRELQLPLDASPDEIRAAFRQHAKKTHPDHDGDAGAMQRLNEAKKMALESADLAEHPGQALILREVLNVEAKRQRQEAARAAGRRLVDGTAAFEIGRLKQLQRHASTVTVASAAVAALAGLLRFLSASGGPALDLILGTLAVFAIVSALYRTLLSERVKRIESAIEEVGKAISARAIYAEIFSVVTSDLINPVEFRERDVALAIDLWLQKVEWGHWQDRLASRELDEDEPAEFITLEEVLRHCAEQWHPAPAFRALRRHTLGGNLQFFGSGAGLGYETRDLVNAASTGHGRYPCKWEEVVDSVRTLSEKPVSWRSDRARNEVTTRRAIRGFLQSADPDGADWVSGRFERLAREVGTVDLARLLLGKGLENEMLAEEEAVDERGRLETAYSYVVEARRSND